MALHSPMWAYFSMMETNDSVACSKKSDTKENNFYIWKEYEAATNVNVSGHPVNKGKASGLVTSVEVFNESNYLLICFG